MYLLNDDVKGAVRQYKYYHDVATPFSFIIVSFLFIPMEGNFGSIVSPTYFEPFSQVRNHLPDFSQLEDIY